MALLKLNPIVPYIRGKQKGFCFSSSRVGQSVKLNPLQRGKRSAARMRSSAYQMSSVENWRNLSPVDKAAWSAWVSYLPQPTLRNNGASLSPYHNYIKINTFRNLFSGRQNDRFLNPELITYEIDSVSIEIQRSNDQLFLSADFTRSDATLCYMFYLSPAVSAGKKYPNSNNRLQLAVLNDSDTFEITDQWLSIFGTLPNAFDTIIIKTQVFGSDNGQFWFPTFDTSEVTEEPVVVVPVGFGYLYSCDCVFGSNSIIRAGWRIPTVSEYSDFITAYGGIFAAQLHICDSDLAYWYSGFSAGDNSSGFYARGSGHIDSDGFLVNFRHSSQIFATLADDPSIFFFLSVNQPTGLVLTGSSAVNDTRGLAIRVVKADEGEQFYEGFNGIKYPVIRFGGLVWSVSNLKETMFSDLSEIPSCSNRSEWLSLSGVRYAVQSDSFNS